MAEKEDRSSWGPAKARPLTGRRQHSLGLTSTWPASWVPEVDKVGGGGEKRRDRHLGPTGWSRAQESPAPEHGGWLPRPGCPPQPTARAPVTKGEL